MDNIASFLQELKVYWN